LMGIFKNKRDTGKANETESAVSGQDAVAPKSETVNMILLGPGSSGKSTFRKHLKLYFQGEFGEREGLYHQSLIRQNALQSIQTLIEGAQTFGYRMSTNETQEAAEQIMDTTLLSGYDPTVGQSISKLWNENAIQRTWKRCCELSDWEESNEFFITEIDRILVSNYMPTVKDILLARQPTTTMILDEFQSSSEKFRVIDIGGYREERRKWLNSLENLNTVVFIVAISEFDQMLFEDNKQNRMLEAMSLFEGTVNSYFFQKTNFILLLNKCDLFDQKVTKKKFKNPIS